MNDPNPNRLSVTTKTTFWELYVGSLVLLRYRWPLMMIFALFPLAGLFLLMTPLMGYRLGPVEILLALFGFLYVPLVIALTVWVSRRRNKLVLGSITYSFDAEGMHTSGATFSQTIRWAAIPRIRLTRRFLFIFISPAKAYCIPLKAIDDPNFFEDLRCIVETQTDFGPDAKREAMPTAQSN
jgi:hypothetical protein